MNARAASLVGLCLVVLASPASARPWPDSSERIIVFSDQLQEGMTEPQREFAATRLAGTQKMRRSEIQAIRAYNTNFLCLHYQLAVGAGPAAFIDGDAWVSDWSVVNAKTNWFLLNTQTQRVHQTAWNWDLMNVTYSNGAANTGFPQYWITTCIARIRSAEDDGVFADSFTQDAYSFGQCDPSHPWLDDVDLCKANWIPNLEAFGRAVMTNFGADGSGYVFLPNLGGLITGWDPMNYGIGDGGMIEGFGFWSSGNWFDPSDWELQMDRALALVRSNKIVICQSYPDTGDRTGRMFAVASHLLIKGSRTYLALVTTEGLEFYPEYTIRLGGATGGVPSSASSLWRAAWGVYRRDFTNGIVLVNPDSTPVSIPNLGGRYLAVTASGGGAVDDEGNVSGSLQYVSVTSATLSAYSGAVLLFPTADCDGDRADNLSELLAGTDMMDSGSVFQISGSGFQNGSFVVSWNSATGRTYRLERVSMLVTEQWSVVTGNVHAVPPMNTVTDRTAVSESRIYRISAE